MKRLLPLLVLVLAAGSSVAQPQGGIGGANPFTRPLDRTAIESNVSYRIYLDPVIQAELKLTAEQKTAIAKIPDDLLVKYKDEIAKEQAAQKEADDKAAAREVEVTKSLDTLLDKRLSAAQRKRFNQLVVRVQGTRAFRDPDVAKALGLTDEQQAKLNDMQREGLEKLNEEFPTTGPVGDAETREKRNAAQTAMYQETIKRFVETFSDDQKKTWVELAGEPSEPAARIGRTTPPVGARGIFTPGSPFALRSTVLNTDKLRAELKLDDKADEALTVGWAEILKDIFQVSTATTTPLFRSRLQSTVTSEAARTAAQVLTAPQTKRLEQIQTQMDGLNAFGGARSTAVRVVGKLHLTPAQAAKIEVVFADTAKQNQANIRPRPTQGSQEEYERALAEFTRKAVEIQQQGLADILATFDAGQKAGWQELVGEPIDVTKMSAGRGGITTGISFSPFGTPGANRIAYALSQEAFGKQDRGEYAAALASIDEALRIAPADPSYLQQKATLLATCPSEWVRDGKQAVELMKKVMAETKGPTYSQLHTLAACYAEAGQFNEAVKAQEKAISMLPPPRAANPNNTRPLVDIATQLKPQYEARLKLYQEKKPYRIEPPAARPPVDR